MKVLMLNGSSHINGTTMAALTEVGKALERDFSDWWRPGRRLPWLRAMYREWVYLLGRCGKCVCRKSKGSGWIYIWYTGLLCASKWTDPVVLRPGILQQR